MERIPEPIKENMAEFILLKNFYHENSKTLTYAALQEKITELSRDKITSIQASSSSSSASSSSSSSAVENQLDMKKSAISSEPAVKNAVFSAGEQMAFLAGQQLGLQQRSRQPCYSWENSGTCKFGDTCRFTHDNLKMSATPTTPPSLKRGADSTTPLSIDRKKNPQRRESPGKVTSSSASRAPGTPGNN